jgi:cytochrome c-type biogenesis protein CcmH/NrfG
MKIIKQQVWTIAGAAALLAVTFSLGYLAGSKSQKTPIETASALTTTDMEHAFGSANPSVHEPAMKEPAAMSLSGLVAGLEKKVAANPENIDQQLLLAQTYNQLDNRAKSLQLLHSLNKQEPKNAQVKITLATILMTGEDKQELKEASQLFDNAIKLNPEVASMARLYQGEIRVKLDNMAKP